MRRYIYIKHSIKNNNRIREIERKQSGLNILETGKTPFKGTHARDFIFGFSQFFGIIQ
jgi:hypothetical protein